MCSTALEEDLALHTKTWARHSTSQLPKAYLDRTKELKLNSLMKYLLRSCLPKVIEDK